MIKSYWVVYTVDNYGEDVYQAGLYRYRENAVARAKELAGYGHDQVYYEQLDVEDE